MHTLLAEAGNILTNMQEIRRDIHRHPELAMQELRTAQIISDYLKKLGLDVESEIGGTGVTATLYTKSKGNTVALRADMDAIPLEDLKTVPYKSIHPGIVHACGHDGHTAMLLGAASLLCKFSSSLQGNVKFIFQPGEERLPGGAIPMIEDGALNNPPVHAIFSLHIRPDFPEGTISVRSGYSTISSAGFVLKTIGKGGHVAVPHDTIDPIAMTGMIITASQTMMSRKKDPLDPAILAFGSIHGGTASNVIPDEVTLTGTIRSVKPKIREDIIRLLDETARGVAQISGGTYDLAIEMGYPSVYNDPNLVNVFRDSATSVTGKDYVTEIDRPWMGGEDVSYFHQKVPGVHWYLGTSNPAKGFIHGLHTSLFDFNEEVMSIGAAVHAQSVIDYLVNK